MKNVAFQIKAETTDSFVFVAGIIDDNKCTLMLMLSDDLVKEGLHAGKIVKEAAKHIKAVVVDNPISLRPAVEHGGPFHCGWRCEREAVGVQ